jgi:hypothetical protein
MFNLFKETMKVLDHYNKHLLKIEVKESQLNYKKVDNK